MRISKHQFISFSATALIFIAIFSYVFGIPASIYNPSFFPIFGKSDSKVSNSGTYKHKSTAKIVDKLDGVNVYYNGPVTNINGRNVTPDGYNLGLKYQCVEFVKRYYYEHFGHKMPDSYGNAKDFFNYSVRDGEMNRSRALLQYSNPSKSKPKKGDLLVFAPTAQNQFGHVAIVSKVLNNSIEFIQQNPGPGNPSREWRDLHMSRNQYNINESLLLGWLRRP